MGHLLRLFVLVGGWPGSGKSTLARALAPELGLALLAKDEIKEVLADELGQPADVTASRRLGRVAVIAMLRIAQGCPGAVLDSTWFDYTRPHLAKLAGRLVEVRCVVPRHVAMDRYYARADRRHGVHLDRERQQSQLWGEPVRALGVGPLVEVDTSGHLDPAQIARSIRNV